MRGIIQEPILQFLRIKEEGELFLSDHFDEITDCHVAMSVWKYLFSKHLSVKGIQICFFISNHLLNIMFRNCNIQSGHLSCEFISFLFRARGAGAIFSSTCSLILAQFLLEIIDNSFFHFIFDLSVLCSHIN